MNWPFTIQLLKKLIFKKMLISLFSFVPQTEPEVFTGQEGEHKNISLANNYNHTVATFDISTY